jgi:tetratricopeptide (TPR) repeat protein
MIERLYPLKDRSSTWMLYAGILAVVSAACFGSLRHHQIYFHDDETFRDNVAISADFSFFFSAEKEQFTGRPVAELVKWIAFAAVDNDPGLSHLVVVGFHTLASFLLALMFSRMGLNLELAFLGGLFFLVDVSHFHSVHHISALDFVLGLIWGTLAVICYLRYLTTSRRQYWVGTCASLLAGVATHVAMAAAWPFLLFWSWNRGMKLKDSWRHHLPLLVSIVLASTYLLSITPADTTTGASFSSFGTRDLPTLLAGFCRMLTWNVSRLFTTAHWVPFPLYLRQTWEFYTGGLILMALLVAIWRGRFPLSAGGAWVLLFTLPFALVAEAVTNEAMEGPSHYLYPASAGSSLLLAWVVQQGGLRLTARLRSWGSILYGLGLLVILGSSYVSLKRVEAFSYYNSGRYLFATDLKAALDCFQRALDMGQEVLKLDEAYTRLAIAMPIVGDDPLPLLREGLARFPDSFALNTAMAVVESEAADPESRKRGQRRLKVTRESAQRAGVSRTFDLNAASMYHNMARGYVKSGDPIRAIGIFNRALKLSPVRDKTLSLLGDACLALGAQIEQQEMLAEAYDVFQAECANHTAAQLKLGWHLAQKGQWDEAIEMYQSLLARESNSQARLNLGLILLATGDVTQAEVAITRALDEVDSERDQTIRNVEDQLRLIEKGSFGTEALRIVQAHARSVSADSLTIR